MNDERLRELYARSGARAGAAGEHPSPEAIAALARREGGEAERLATLDHVMSCPDCRSDFDLLRSVERAGTSERSGGGTARRAWLMPAALAASLALAVGVGSAVLRSPGDDATRGGDAGGLVLVAPGAEAPAGDEVTFAWRGVAGTRRYELELLDASGNVAVAAETADTVVSPAAARSLPPGDYRWWVRAATSDARPLRSALRPLRLTAR
jgi:hypothetical protein